MKWCLFVLLIVTVVIGSIHSNPIENDAPLFKEIEWNFFRKCVRISGDEEIVPQIQKLSLEFGKCEGGIFGQFMETTLQYIKGPSDIDIENFLGLQCPHMKNSVACTSKFVKDASVCYEKETYDLMMRQATEMENMIDWLCENDGEHVKAAKEAKIVDCIEKFKTPVAACLSVADDNNEPTVPISYQPIKMPSQIVCGMAKVKHCILEATNSCAGSAVIGEIIDILTPFLGAACPAENLN